MLRDYYEEVGISHETSVARSPQQNEVVKRRNRTLIEVARTMLIYAQAPLFLWVEAVATAYFTQNRSIIHLRHGKTPFSPTTCFIRNLEGVDLLTGSRGNNLYTLSLQDMMASSPICLLSSACAMGKSTKKSHKPKSEDTNQEKLYLLHMDFCRPMRVESINGKKYILVIVDDYSRFTWVKFLRSKDETPMFIIKFLKMIQVRLNVPVRRIRIDNGTEFVNQTLRDYYEEVGISHETSVAHSPQQNGVVERRNRTLIEAARTMLIYAQAPLLLWAEAMQPHVLHIRLRHGKTPYELMHGSWRNNLYTLSLQDMMASSSICLLSKASKTKFWL
nr:hypothetical protein [Tanacetum cinerariifolium]